LPFTLNQKKLYSFNPKTFINCNRQIF